MIENISLKDFILKNWNKYYIDDNSIDKIKKKKETEKNLTLYMADKISYKDFVKRYTDYTLDNVSFNGLVDAFYTYKCDIMPFDFELPGANYSKKYVLVKDVSNYFKDDDEDDALNF